MNKTPDGFSVRGVFFALSYAHFLPADVAVYIVDKEHGKAYGNGNIAYVVNACQYPQNYKNHIIRGICQGEIRASSEGEI